MGETPSNKVKGLEKNFECIEQQMPSIKPITDAFKEIFIGRATLKANLPERPDINIPLPDHSRFSIGEPWLTKEIIASFVDSWGDTVESTLQSLVKAFPNIEADLLRLRESLAKGDLDLKYCIVTFLKNREEEICEIASRIDVRPIMLNFILSQILKPFVEKRTESLRSLIQNVPWYKGYCPICGSYPELSFLQGNEGQRWLRCSLCGYEWRFDRMLCPYCERIDYKSKELSYIEGRQYEWVELCVNCHRYIVSTDLRERKGNVATEVAAISMVYLDFIAQRKGFSPIADCAWNIAIPEN